MLSDGAVGRSSCDEAENDRICGVEILSVVGLVCDIGLNEAEYFVCWSVWV